MKRNLIGILIISVTVAVSFAVPQSVPAKASGWIDVPFAYCASHNTYGYNWLLGSWRDGATIYCKWGAWGRSNVTLRFPATQACQWYMNSSYAGFNPVTQSCFIPKGPGGGSVGGW